MQQALSRVLLVLKRYWLRILLVVSVSCLFVGFCVWVYKSDRVYQIQGVVTDIKFLPAQGWGHSDYTVIKFDDGREKVFSEINEALVFQKGKVNVIEYTSMGIVSVEVK